MDAATLLSIKADLGKLKHKGALTTEQFGLLKRRAKYGAVTGQVLAHFEAGLQHATLAGAPAMHG